MSYDDRAIPRQLLKDMRRALAYLKQTPTRRSELVTIQTLASELNMDWSANRKQRAAANKIVNEAVGLFNYHHSRGWR